MYGILAILLGLALAYIEDTAHATASAASHAAYDENPYGDEKQCGTHAEQNLPEARIGCLIVYLSGEFLCRLLCGEVFFHLIGRTEIHHDIGLCPHIACSGLEDLSHMVGLDIHLQL